MVRRLILLILLSGLLVRCANPPAASTTTSTPRPAPAASAVPPAAPPIAQPPATQSYRVVNSYPHDPQAFTQGLVIDNGVLYEGTGLEGRSTLRMVNLESGAVLKRYDLPATVFGEGITVLGDRIFQLTWQSGIGYVYRKSDFSLLQTWNYAHEGWGITDDDTRLIVSDGTATIRFLDPATLQTTSQITASDDRGLVTNLNELEYIRGEIYANIWQTDRIARIDPASGKVLGWLDLSGLLPTEDRQQQVDVLNGIAYDAANDRLFVTGKWWPKLFEIEPVEVGRMK